MKTTKEMLAYITNTTEGICDEAIDGGHSQMPPNNYDFIQNKDGSCTLIYVDVFNTGDGYDSMEHDCGTFADKAAAIKHAYNIDIEVEEHASIPY